MFHAIETEPVPVPVGKFKFDGFWNSSPKTLKGDGVIVVFEIFMYEMWLSYESHY